MAFAAYRVGGPREIRAFHLPRTLLQQKKKIFFALSVKRKLSNETSRPHVLSLIACENDSPEIRSQTSFG
jgi:hypothetical protein